MNLLLVYQHSELTLLLGIFFKFRFACLVCEIGRWDDDRALRRCLGLAMAQIEELKFLGYMLSRDRGNCPASILHFLCSFSHPCLPWHTSRLKPKHP